MAAASPLLCRRFLSARPRCRRGPLKRRRTPRQHRRPPPAHLRPRSRSLLQTPPDRRCVPPSPGNRRGPSKRRRSRPRMPQNRPQPHPEHRRPGTGHPAAHPERFCPRPGQRRRSGDSLPPAFRPPPWPCRCPGWGVSARRPPGRWATAPRASPRPERRPPPPAVSPPPCPGAAPPPPRSRSGKR